MFNQLIRFCLIFTTLVASSAWAQDRITDTHKPTLEKVRLQLKWFHQFQFAGYYAAIEQGYYAQEGLEVEIQERVLEKNFVKQVTSGESEYGVGDSGLLSQYAKGEKVAALAAIFQHNPLVFIAKQSSGITSPYEMRGKRVMADIVSTNEAPLRAMLVSTDIIEQDYQLIPQTNDYSLLIHDKVDVISGYVTDQPFFYNEQGIKVNVINPQNYGIDFYGDILFTSQSELREHPGRADRFLRASLKGWRYALEHPEELIQLISKKYHSRLSMAHLRFEATETRKLILPDVVPLGQIKPLRMKMVADVYARAGLSPSLTESELSAFIYKSQSSALNLTTEERAWLARHPVIRVGIDRDFAPYEWVDEHGRYVGLAADYMSLLEKKLGVRFEIIKNQPWANVLDMAKRGELDLLSCVVKTEGRLQYLTFTEPYKSTHAIIVDNGQGDFLVDLDHLAGKRVAIENGYFMHELLQKDHPQINLVLAQNTLEALQMVMDGKADAYVGDAGTTHYMIKKQGLLTLRYSGHTEYKSQHSVAISNAHPELASIIAKAMASIPQEQADAIFNRWLGLQVEPGIQPKILIKYGVGLSILLMLFAYWTYRMKREIATRKAAELRENLRSNVLEKLATDSTLAHILKEIVSSAEQINPGMLCSILLLDEDGKRLGNAVAPSLPSFYNQAINGIEIGTGVGACGSAAFSGERVIVEDISTHPYWVPYKELAANAGLASCWSQPILSTSGEVLGTFAIYHAVPQVPNKFELILIEQYAALASLAIERKRAAAKLLASESRLIGIINAEPECIKIVDAHGLLRQMNPAGLAMIEADSLEQVAGLPVTELIAPEHREAFKKMHARVIAGQSIQMDFEIVSLKGRRRWLETNAVPMREANGEVVHLAVTRDITERKKAEAELRIAATAFESQEGMVVTDANNVILRVNQAFTTITGYLAEDVIGKTPNILSSGKHDKAFYAEMWASITSSGAWEGEIWNRRKNGEIYPEHLTITAVKDANGVLCNYVATIMDITQRKAAVDEIKNLAFYDPLTQLANRRLLIDRLKQALAASARSDQHGAVLFLDLDHFKALNDTLGHDVGDLLLIQVAQRLMASVREGDTVARLGGDEFVVVLEDLSDKMLEAAKQTETIAEKIISALNQPYLLNAHEHISSPSMGAVVFKGHEAEVDVLLRQADIAMYQAKDSGRNALRFFDPKMQEAITFRVELEQELRKALEQKQFALHYQSQVNSSGRIIGAEALIRWQHPERGMISPLHFIPLAEETGLILQIGQWVLEAACVQLQRWQQNPLTHNLTLSINVSAKQFLQAAFVSQVQATIHHHAIDASRLKIELTESLLVGNVKDVVKIMSILSAIGIRFSLDDFGTGYSSLQYLKTLPLNQLKIDQSFVRDIATDNQDKAIVRTIIAMAHSLDLDVIAEGVETLEQKEFLLENHCTHYQGYLFSKPLPIEDFEAFLSKK
jgi:diguanylate cyclase (GGDEF)-like protein/PAS domain S-box-containing protein